MSYCYYYQAQVKKAQTWFLVAILRSFEHLAFDRTLDKSNAMFEFFVPPALEPFFLQLMKHFQDNGIILYLEKLPNRLQDPNAVV